MADTRRAAIVFALGSLVASAVSLVAAARPQPVLENATVIVQRMRVAPKGVAEFPFRRLATVVVNVGEQSAVYVPPGEDKRVTNATASDIDVIAIGIKPSRPPAGAAPATAAPQGITRDTVIDNDQVRVVHVRFATDGREPVHTHPNDLVTVQLTRGRVEMMIGGRTTTVVCDPGFVKFLPRDTPHTYASADKEPFALLSIAIK